MNEHDQSSDLLKKVAVLTRTTEILAEEVKRSTDRTGFSREVAEIQNKAHARAVLEEAEGATSLEPERYIAILRDDGWIDVKDTQTRIGGTHPVIASISVRGN